MVNEEDKGSFVDPKEVQQSTPRTPQQPQGDTNYRLWTLLEQIRDAIKESSTATNNNSVAINNLVSTIFMKGQVIEPPQRPMPKPAIPQPLIAEPLPQKTANDPIAKVEAMFDAEIANMLEFKVDKDTIVIKPRMFLGSDIFAKVASVVRGANGEYVSAGKGSHFKVPV